MFQYKHVINNTLLKLISSKVLLLNLNLSLSLTCYCESHPVITCYMNNYVAISFDFFLNMQDINPLNSTMNYYWEDVPDNGIVG